MALMGIVVDVFLPLALAFIMFALGLGLTGSDFLRVAKKQYVASLIAKQKVQLLKSPS